MDLQDVERVVREELLSSATAHVGVRDRNTGERTIQVYRGLPRIGERVTVTQANGQRRRARVADVLRRPVTDRKLDVLDVDYES